MYENVEESCCRAEKGEAETKVLGLMPKANEMPVMNRELFEESDQ
jgi:hypothetical protein